MERITITIEDSQLASLDEHIKKRGYTSRSEAIRDILRNAQSDETTLQDPSAFCYATLSCVYEHETRELSKRLTELQHEHHDLSVATLHVHASHNECLEVVILKGTIGQVQALADEILTQRGVRMGHLHIVPSPDLVDGHDHHHHHSDTNTD